MKEAVLLKKLHISPFIRMDKSTQMLTAYHKMISQSADYAILSHNGMVDIGFVTRKDIINFLAHKYIPDQEINAGKGAIIQIKYNDEEGRNPQLRKNISLVSTINNKSGFGLNLS